MPTPHAVTYRRGVQRLTEFVRETLVTPRGVPDVDTPVPERIAALDEHMATTEVLTWSVTAGAGAIGAASFVRLVRAPRTASTASLVSRATVCTWSLVAIALAKLWHAQAQHHTAEMKELLLLRDQEGLTPVVGAGGRHLSTKPS
jgi:hypothetical protein